MLLINERRPKMVWTMRGALVLALTSWTLYTSYIPDDSGGAMPQRAVAKAKVVGSDAPAGASPSSDKPQTERPADISPQEWQELVDALRNHPQRDEELKRLIDYTRFKRDVDQWTALKDQPDARARAQAGQRVLDALPARFANQEVTGPEALMMQSAIYADMIPDEAQRKPIEEAARQALARVMMQDTVMAAKLATDETQMARYKAREAEITGRFNDKLIDQAQMEKELDAARVKAFR